MHSDGNTLPDDVDEALVVGAHRLDGSADAFVLAHLDDPLARRRILALRAAHRRGLLSPEQGGRALDDVDARVRRESLAMIADTASDDPTLRDAVIARLGDADPLVVDAAAFALGELLEVGAVEKLIEVATSHDDARCRESAIAALGAIGDDRARDAIVGALDDKPPVRRRAIVALANFEGPDIDAALARASEDRDWQVRAAADQLGRDEPDS